jgi:hypothetical protein
MACDTNSYYYGDKLGDERIDNEFKTFSLRHIDLTGSLTAIEKIIRRKKWSCLRKVCQRKQIYDLKKYVKKYFSSFINTSSIDQGLLWYGVNDYGEMIGIPFLLDPYKMLKIIKDEVLELLKDQDICDSTVHKILESISIEPIELKSNGEKSQVSSYLRKFEKEKEIFCDTIDGYHRERLRLISLTRYYKRKINIMFNERPIRQELIEFIKEHPLNAEQNITEELKTRMITILKSDFFIDYVKGEVTIKKHDPQNLAYWIAIFRDKMTDQFKELQPERPIISQPDDPYLRIIREIEIINRPIMESGEKLFIVKIGFPGKKLFPDLPLISHKSRFLERRLTPMGDPCCK